MTGSPLFLLTFCLAILLTYLSIRRRWLPVIPTSAIGAVVACVSFVLFSLSSGNGIVQALVVGIMLGLLFTGMNISMAMYFRSNPPTPKSPIAPPPTPIITDGEIPDDSAFELPPPRDKSKPKA